MSEFLALYYESKYDFLLHLCTFDVVTGYKRTPFGRFLNSKKNKILRTYRNKHLNIESKRNKHFIKLIIYKEVLKLQNYELVFLWLHFWSTRSMKTPEHPGLCFVLSRTSGAFNSFGLLRDTSSRPIFSWTPSPSKYTNGRRMLIAIVCVVR
jgi:hypothetical protein